MAKNLQRAEPVEDSPEAVDRLTRALAARELRSRFVGALERGEIDGDIVVVDQAGNPVKGAPPPVSIYDVD